MLENHILLFIITAGLCFFILWGMVKHRTTPLISAIIHGGTALLAIFLLFFFADHFNNAGVLTNLVLFCIVMLSAFTIYAIDGTKHKPSSTLTSIQTTIGVCSLIMLLTFTLNII